MGCVAVRLAIAGVPEIPPPPLVLFSSVARVFSQCFRALAATFTLPPLAFENIVSTFAV
jgi:hypothetical protein